MMLNIMYWRKKGKKIPTGRPHPVALMFSAFSSKEVDAEGCHDR